MKITKKLIAIVLAVLMSLGNLLITGFAAESETPEHQTEISEGYVGVYTKDDLDNIKLNMSGKYILMNDIVFEDKDFEKGGDFYNSGKGWAPIGTSSTRFTGILDGNGYTIKNLYINAPEQDYIGLFGYASGATIKNISLTNFNIKGCGRTGSIAGCSYYSTITNCYCNGNVIGYDRTGGVVGCLSTTTLTNCNYIGDITGNNYVGGITGCSDSAEETTISNCCTQGLIVGKQFVGGITGYQRATGGIVTSSYTSAYSENYIKYCNNASVIMGESYIGGISGYTESYYKYIDYDGYGHYDVRFSGASYIECCSNSGSITANNYNAGGITGCSGGNNRNYVYYCYNCGDVSASSFAGGLIGQNDTTETWVKNCYSVGTITAKADLGGCFGSNLSDVVFCYYLDEAVINPTYTDGIEKSRDQMIKQTAYEQWDFNTIWTMAGREDYPYPELINTPLVLPEDSQHKHEYTSAVTTPATHTLTGVMTYTCSCGDTYTEEIEKTPGHSYTSKVTTPATHTSTGVMTYTCSCGDTYTEVIEKIADHSYNAVVTAPTCTKQGFTTYTCECGDSYIDDYIDANGHREGGWVVTKPATITSTGTKTQNCSVCGELLATEIIPMLPAKVHSVSVSGVSLDYKSTGTIATAINADTGAKYTVTYSSSNPSVASVDANGKVTAGKTGNATITCTVTDEYGNVVTDTCEVKVSYNWWQWIIVIVLFGWIWY